MGYLLRWPILLFATLVLLPPGALRAEDKDAKQFFPDGFARTPLGANQGQARAQRPTPAPNSTVPLATSSDRSGMVLLDDSTPSPIPTTEPAPGETPDEPLVRENGVTIKSLRVFVNGDDRSHFINVVGAVGRININYNIPVSSVMTVGLFEMKDNTAPPELVRMMLLGTPVSTMGVPPEDYHAERSPLWELSTERGTVLIEGVESIEPYLLKSGKLKEHIFDHPPSGLQVVETPTPTPVPAAP